MRLSLLLAFLIATFVGHTQITVTSSVFPASGDTLSLAVDNLPANLSLGTFGGPQFWDFTALQAPFTTDQAFLEASEGSAFADFPNADVYTDLPATGEGYYRITNNEVRLLGFYGSDPVGIGVNLAFKYTPPLIEQRAPLNFGDTFNSEASVLAPFSTDIIPSAFLDSLPISPDSLRIRINIERDESIDAYGEMNIPGGTFEVLRMARDQAQEVRLEAKVPFLNWVDVTDLVPANPFLGVFETKAYIFYGADSKEPIAQVQVDAETEAIQSVQYKSVDETINSLFKLDDQPAIFAYPNPAIEDVRFEFANLPTGQYTLKIYNILGVVVWEKDYQISGKRTVRENLGRLRKGTYLYSLVAPTGKTIATKRLLIVRP